MRRAPLLLLLALAAGGCAHTPGLGAKTVADKQPPNRLVAMDASECVVSDEKFEEVEVGKRALCLWSSPGGALPGRPFPRTRPGPVVTGER